MKNKKIVTLISLVAVVALLVGIGVAVFAANEPGVTLAAVSSEGMVTTVDVILENIPSDQKIDYALISIKLNSEDFEIVSVAPNAYSDGSFGVYHKADKTSVTATVERENASFQGFADGAKLFQIKLENTSDVILSEAKLTVEAQLTAMDGSVIVDDASDVTVRISYTQHTHALTFVPETPKTCTADGVKAHWMCDRDGCEAKGQRYADAEGKTEANDDSLKIPASHELVEHAAQEATCLADGVLHHWNCTACGKNYADADAADLLDSIVDPKKDHQMTHYESQTPSCTGDGNVEYWHCSTCDKNYADQAGTQELSSVVDQANGHALVKVDKKAATCTEDGIVEHWKCGNCGNLFADEAGKNPISEADTVEAAKGHDLIAVEGKDATCTEDGWSAHWKCETCGALFSDAEGTTATTEDAVKLVAPGHKLTHVPAVDPTTEAEGNVEYWICEVCGAMFYDENGTSAVEKPEDVVLGKLPMNPPTSDSAMLLPALMLGMLSVGAVVVLSNKRKAV